MLTGKPLLKSLILKNILLNCYILNFNLQRIYLKWSLCYSTFSFLPHLQISCFFSLLTNSAFYRRYSSSILLFVPELKDLCFLCTLTEQCHFIVLNMLYPKAGEQCRNCSGIDSPSCSRTCLRTEIHDISLSVNTLKHFWIIKSELLGMAILLQRSFSTVCYNTVTASETTGLLEETEWLCETSLTAVLIKVWMEVSHHDMKFQMKRLKKNHTAAAWAPRKRLISY